jgi:hypothetical protein
MRVLGVVALAIFIAGCAGEPVVAESSQDRVQIYANGAPTHEIQSKPDQACAMYKRSAQVLSHRYEDGFCVQEVVLFACSSTSDTSGRQ